MAEITLDRDAYVKLQNGNHKMVDGDSRLASFLANKFREGEAEARAMAGDEPTWVYAIWTYRF